MMMLNDKRILITAGGTGGHVFPALSVAKAMVAQGATVSWLGTRRGIESTVVPENGFDINYIGVEGLRGKSKASLVLAPFKLFRALWQAFHIVRKSNPDCVVGFGGFVAGPGGAVTKLLGVPLVIHEQNSVAGLTNTWLSKISERVLTGFPNVRGLPNTALWVGNPVRDDIKPCEKAQEKRHRVRVLVVGGSQGAHSFNMKLPKLFSEMDVELKIQHQAGRGKSQQVRSLYESYKLDARVVEFIDDMAVAYQWADLLICRAGAMTVAECCAAAKPALFVPYPFSAGDHQIHNANSMVDAGAGEIVLNEKLDSQDMLDVLTKLVSGRDHLRDMGRCAHELHRPHATEAVLKVVSEVVNA